MMLPMKLTTKLGGGNAKGAGKKPKPSSDSSVKAMLEDSDSDE